MGSQGEIKRNPDNPRVPSQDLEVLISGRHVKNTKHPLLVIGNNDGNVGPGPFLFAGLSDIRKTCFFYTLPAPETSGPGQAQGRPLVSGAGSE